MKIKFLGFVGISLVVLGMTACSSVPKLDLSTLDPSQPVEVGGVYMYAYKSSSDEFYGKYGESLRNPSDQLTPADKDQLLEILCGTAAENWDFIVNAVMTKTGLSLNGDKFKQDLEYGESIRILSQELQLSLGYFYSWNIMDIEYPMAVIGLVFDRPSATMEVNQITIETGDIDTWGTITNQRQTKISLR